MLGLMGLSGSAQVPNWAWAKSSASGYGKSLSVATDNFGNVYACGFFYSPTFIFSTDTLTNATINNDSMDIFLVKYDANGNVLWAKRAGGSSWDFGEAVTVDNWGNIYLTGYYWSESIIFGSDTLHNIQGALAVGDIFIVKYDSNGNELWAKSFGGNSNDAANCVTTDPSGNVYIAGLFQSDSITFGTTTLMNYGNNSPCQIFLTKLDSSGQVLWAKGVGGVMDDWLSAIKTDALGNLYIAGCYQSDSITFGTFTLINASANLINLYLAKYDTNGNVLWAKGAGGVNNDGASSITIDASQNVF